MGDALLRMKLIFVVLEGHVGGAVLDIISATYPEVELTVLVRDETKASRLVSKYYKVTPVIGDLHSLELLESASKNASIVISA